MNLENYFFYCCSSKAVTVVRILFHASAGRIPVRCLPVGRPADSRITDYTVFVKATSPSLLPIEVKGCGGDGCCCGSEGL